MRFSQDDLKEAVSHKDWVERLVTALTHEEESVEPGPVAAVGS